MLRGTQARKRESTDGVLLEVYPNTLQVLRAQLLQEQPQNPCPHLPGEDYKIQQEKSIFHLKQVGWNSICKLVIPQIEIGTTANSFCPLINSTRKHKKFHKK